MLKKPNYQLTTLATAALRLVPVKTRMPQTFLGRVGYRGMQGLGYLAAFSVFFPLAMVLVGLVTWVLMEIRGPLRQVLGLL